MEKKFSEEEAGWLEFERIYRAGFLYFNKLALHLNGMALLYENYFTAFADWHFPPTKEEADTLSQFFGHHSDHIIRELDKVKYMNALNDFCANFGKELADLDIKSAPPFTELAGFCCYIRDLYRLPAVIPWEKRAEVLTRVLGMGHHISNKVYETIGYWTAKMEQKKTSRKAADVRVSKKLNRMQEIKDLMKKDPNAIGRKNFIPEAMKITDLGERRIKDLVRVILSEEKK